MSNLGAYQCDDELAIAPLNALGWSVTTHDWREPSVDWSAYHLVVVRSTWDYQNRLEEYVHALRRIVGSGAVLANPLAMIEWNIDKRYLAELAAQGVDIVPTHWGRAGALPDTADLFAALGCNEIVLKRVVGAGAQDAYRLREGATEAICGEVQSAYADQDWMAQPFLDSVMTEGESSLFFFNGEFSHAVRKIPKAGDYRVQEEHGGTLTRIDPDVNLRIAAETVMTRVADTPLYARVDLVLGPAATYQLMELELIEPALYLRMDESAAGRFAHALDRWWNHRLSREQGI